MKKITLFLYMAMVATAANATIYYVDGSAESSGNGTSWATAFKTITEGIDSAANDTEHNAVYVKGGTYAIDTSLPQKAVKIYGSFAGTETSPSERTLATTGSKPWDFASKTIVDASEWAASAGRIFGATNGGSADAKALTIDGLTLQGRNLTTNEQAPVIYASAGLVMQNCVVQNNSHAKNEGNTGGAITLNTSNTGQFLIKDCKISSNAVTPASTGGEGGGIYVTGGNIASALITGCLFSENSARSGGGIYVKNGDVVVENSVFTGNTSQYEGGAARVNAGRLILKNCVMEKNKAGMANGGYQYGAAVYRGGGNLSILSCVVADNGTPNVEDGAVSGSNLGVYNTIFYSNQVPAVPANQSNVFFYNNIYTGTLPTAMYSDGNILYSGDGSSLFTNAAAGDYSLAAGSPALGAGVRVAPFAMLRFGQPTDVGISGSNSGWVETESPYFYLQFAQRTANVLQDTGNNAAPLAKQAYPGNANQLWKLVPDGDYFKLQSKSGRYLDMVPNGSSGGTFSAKQTSTSDASSKFKLEVSSNTGYVQLRGGYPAFADVVNKGNSGEVVAAWNTNSAGDNGNSLVFIPENAMPELNKWYQIYTLGGATTVDLSATKVWQGNGVGQQLVNANPNSSDTSQFWKLVAAEGGVKIQGLDGTYFKKPDGNNQTNTEADGDVFTLEWSEYDKKTSDNSKLQRRWSLRNTAISGSDSYLATSSQYWGNGADREVEFVPVVPSITLGLDSILFGSFSSASAAAAMQLAVEPRFVTQAVEFAFEGDGKDPFSAAYADGWDGKSSGTLNVTFNPTGLSAGDYAAKLILTGRSPELAAVVTDTVALFATVADPVNVTIVRDTNTVNVTSHVGATNTYTVGKGTLVVEFTIPAVDIAEASIGTVAASPLACEPLGGGRYRITVQNVQTDTTVTIYSLHKDSEESPLLASSEGSEHWYYVKFEKRDWTSGAEQRYLYDQGAGEPLIVVPAINLDRDGAKWKLVADSTGAYKLVSKKGNEVAYAATALGGVSAVGADRFYAAAASDERYKLIADGSYPAFYQINRVSDGGSKSLDKNTLTNQVDGYKGTGEGTAVSFIPEAAAPAPTGAESRFPVITTTNNNDGFYYRISFARRELSGNAQDGKVITDKGAGNALAQESLEVGNMAQYWRLRPVDTVLTKIVDGAGSNLFKVESYDGNQFAETSSKSAADGAGSSYRFFKSTITGDLAGGWLLQRDGGNYVNSPGGTNASNTTVGEYSSQSDGGSVLKFTYVSAAPEIILGGAAVEFGVVPIGANQSLQLTVSTLHRLTDEITYELTGANADRFAADTAAGWSATLGGTLNITYTPTTENVDSATLAIKSVGDGLLVEVALTGAGTLGPNVAVRPAELSFTGVAVGLNSDAKVLLLTGGNLDYPNDSAVTYTLAGGSGSAFSLSRASATLAAASYRDTVSVVFKPDAGETYNDTLVINAPGLPEPQRVPLLGQGVTPNLPVTLSTEGSEHWYYIQVVESSNSSVVSGGLLYDAGAGARVHTPADMGEGALWKVVGTDTSGRYKLISKPGNELALGNDTLTAAGAGQAFDLEPSGTYWKIKHRGTETYLRKSGYSYVGSETGSTFTFLPEASVGLSEYPAISEDEAEHWYQVIFKNRSAHAAQDMGEAVNVSLNNGVDTANTAQLWKLVATEVPGVYRVVGYSGREFKHVGSAIQAVAAGSGNLFSLEWTKASTSSGWALRNLSGGPSADRLYLSSAEVIEQWANHVDRLLSFDQVALLASSDATLSNLTVSEGTLTPDFSPDDTAYTVSVDNSVESITLTATAAHDSATVSGDGVKALNVGDNPFTITVTAQDGTTTKAYTVTVTREEEGVTPPPAPSSDATLSSLTVSEGTLTPAFSPGDTAYTVSVGNSVESITLTATAAHDSATVSGDGVKALNVGDNPFTITVTAEDGTTTKAYTVTVTRDEAATGVGVVAKSLLRLYPNPVTNGELTVENGDLKAGERILIYALSGSLAATYEVATGAVTVINVSRLPQGVYVVKAGAYAARVSVY